MKKLKELVREYNQQKSVNNRIIRKIEQLLKDVYITYEDVTNGQIGEYSYQLTHRAVPEVHHPFSLAETIISYKVSKLDIYNSEKELLLSMDIRHDYLKYSITLYTYNSDKLIQTNYQKKKSNKSFRKYLSNINTLICKLNYFINKRILYNDQ